MRVGIVAPTEWTTEKVSLDSQSSPATGVALSFAWAVSCKPVDGFVGEVVGVFVSKLGYGDVGSKADARAKRVVDVAERLVGGKQPERIEEMNRRP
jgi:hypothetical protein